MRRNAGVREHPSDLISPDFRRRATLGIYYLFLTLLAALYLVPATWLLSSSLRTNANMFDLNQWFPHPITLEHYTNLLQVMPKIWTFTYNTAFITVLATAGTLFSCSLAGYALARLRFPGKSVLLFSLVLTLMIPAQVTLIPIYRLFRELELINTPWPLIVPALFGAGAAPAGPLVTFFFRQYFLTIPMDFDDAATVDGAGRFQIYWRIILPLSKPALWAMGLLTFIMQWNSYFGPSVYLQRQNQWVLTQGIIFLIGRYASQFGEVTAGIVVMSIPMVVLYIFGQRYIVRGITSSGIKG